MDIDAAWLQPTEYLDYEHPAVARFADAALTGVDDDDPTAVAVGLFLAVRDGIRYDPYVMSSDPAAFRASAVAECAANWCVPKSVLLSATARLHGIPARLGYADVRNHLTSEKLSESMGTDLFLWHGYSELLLDGQWLKLSSAFNIELCQRFGVKVLEFDGTDHALMHPFDEAGNRHMEYIAERGSFDDLPLAEIFDSFHEVYPMWRALDGNGSDAASAGDTAFAG